MFQRLNEMRERREAGFTLIELMVVVLIIAILIAIAIPTFLGLRERAQNRAAQSNLRNGLTAAKAFYTDDETYVGFDVAAAEAIEPSLTYNVAGTAVQDQVSLRPAAAPGQSIVVATVSASGDVFCLADTTSSGTSQGTADAATAADCTGGW